MCHVRYPAEENERGELTMKKGDLFEGIVDVIEFPNKGIVTVDGERIVVKNALPGQRIQGVLTKKSKGKS